MADENKTEFKVSEEDLKKMVTGVAAINDKQAELEEKLDPLDVDALNKAKDDVIKLHEDAQAAAQERTAQAEAIKSLTKAVEKGLRSPETGERKEYEEAFSQYMKKGVSVDSSLIDGIVADMIEKGCYGVTDNDKEMLKKDLSAGSNVDGGFWLTTDRSSRISTRVFETSPIRSIATIETTTSDLWEIILDDDETDYGWVGEVTARPDTNTPEIGLIKIPIHEIYAQPRATQKILDDAGFDIAGWLERKVGARFTRAENTSFVTGDGASKPKGFLTYAAWAAAGTYERNAIEQITSAASGVIDADDLIKFQGSLISDYDPNAMWGMKRKTLYDNIFTLKAGTTNEYLINPRIVAEGGQLVLLGKPIVLMNDLPDVAANSLSVVYGDFREGYTIVDRFGIRVLRDVYTAKPYTKFYTTKRVGAGVTNFEAIKILKTKS